MIKIRHRLIEKGYTRTDLLIMPFWELMKIIEYHNELNA